MDVKSVNDNVYNVDKIRKLKENAQKKIERYLPRSKATTASVVGLEGTPSLNQL